MTIAGDADMAFVTTRVSAGPHPKAGLRHALRRAAMRTRDIVIASMLLLVLAPTFGVIALLIRRVDGGPVFFRQERVGLGGRTFRLIKFRSMYVGNDDAAFRAHIAKSLVDPGPAKNGSYKLDHDPRVTPIGHWLRRLSIDELPQLINVVRGEMSLVGPRPALPWETELFPAEFARRTDVRPGLTGLWQVSGRSRLSTLQMLEYDLIYVARQTFLFDVGILLRTIPTLLRGDGAR